VSFIFLPLGSPVPQRKTKKREKRGREEPPRITDDLSELEKALGEKEEEREPVWRSPHYDGQRGPASPEKKGKRKGEGRFPAMRRSEEGRNRKESLRQLSSSSAPGWRKKKPGATTSRKTPPPPKGGRGGKEEKGESKLHGPCTPLFISPTYSHFAKEKEGKKKKKEGGEKFCHGEGSVAKRFSHAS